MTSPSGGAGPSGNLPALYSEARASLDLMNEARDWRPTAGAEIVGMLVGGRPKVGVQGAGEQFLVRTASGVVAIWLTPWWKQTLAAWGAEVGHTIAISYQGKERSPYSGREYNAFNVTVLKPVKPAA